MSSSMTSYPPSLWHGTNHTTHADQTTNVFGTGWLPTNLAALKAHAALGDGNWTNPAFAAHEYVVLGDGSLAKWSGTAWSAFTPPPPPPPGGDPEPEPEPEPEPMPEPEPDPDPCDDEDDTP